MVQQRAGRHRDGCHKICLSPEGSDPSRRLSFSSLALLRVVGIFKGLDTHHLPNTARPKVAMVRFIDERDFSGAITHICSFLFLHEHTRGFISHSLPAKPKG